MSETTTDRLAEIEAQAEYTPPDGWRLLAEGETISPGDQWVRPDDGRVFASIRTSGCVLKGTRYIRRIGPEPEPQPQPVPQPVQVREGRWRTRGGEVRNVTPTPKRDGEVLLYPWWDRSKLQAWTANGQYHTAGSSKLDLVEYLGPIEPEPQPEPKPDYTPPEGWRLLQVGEVLEDEDWLIDPRSGNGCWTKNAGSKVGEHHVGEHQIYIRRIESEPEPFITPDDVAAEALAGVHDSAVVANPFQAIRELKQKLQTTEAALLEQQQQNEQLVTQGSQQHMQIQELRSEVSHVQRLLGDEKRRFAELETLTSDLRAVNAAQEKAVNSAARDKADLQHRLDTVAAEWAVQAERIARLNSEIHGLSIQNAELLAQREAVKDELVQERLERNQWQNHAQRTETQLVEKVNECRNLRIELDSLQQAPQTEPVAAAEAVSDRFDQGFEQGTARAVETIAEWTEAFRTCGSQGLSYHVMQNLPHIMRSLTGLTDED